MSLTYKYGFKLLFALVALLSVSGWIMLPEENSNSSDAPNILFLISDDQSAESLGAYGNQQIKTPNLDQLASEGILFTRAYASSPQCSPSRASILTGQIPHDVEASRLHSAVPKSEPNLIELLNKNGYYTGAYRKVHQPSIKDDFQFYRDDDEPLDTFFRQRPKDKPFFLQFGSTDPHRGYKPDSIENLHNADDLIVPDFLPDTPEVRRDLANYYDEIARFDKESGHLLSLLEKRGLADNTIVVMTSDHGMPFPRAKGTLYESGLRVPLIIRWPGVVSTGETTNALVSLMDLTATWLEAAGIAIPEIMQSHSMMPLLQGKTNSIRDYVFAERNWHDNWDPMRTIIGDRYKLIQRYRPEFPYTPSLDLQNAPSYKEISRLSSSDKLSGKLSWYSQFSQASRPQVEFYDLSEDPGEWNNLAEEGRQRSAAKQKEGIYHYQLELSQWMNQTHDFLPPPRAAFGNDPNSDLNENINPLNAQPYEKDQ